MPGFKFKDVWESLSAAGREEEDLGFVWDFLGKDMMNKELDWFFKDGEPLISLRPETGSLSFDKKGLVEGFWEECRVWTKPGSKRQKVLSRYERYLEIGAPSNFAKHSEWSKWQSREDLKIMCLRPPECSWINIRIMHPVFHEIVEILERGTPESSDFLLAAELAASMPESYPVEDERRDAILNIFNKYVPDSAARAIGVKCIAGKFGSDGTCQPAGTNFEFKNEKGLGNSDPYMQNVGYFVQFWGSKADSGPRRHCCPWMLVECIGQEIGISGAVWACGYPCAQPLSSNVPFLPVPADKVTRIRQARLCMAIRHGFHTLQVFYANEPSRDDPQAGYPYVRTCRFNGRNVDLTYLEPFFAEKERKMLFVAEAGDASDKHRVLVKFTDQYNERAHRVASEAGLAPELHYVKDVSGMKMVVMDLLEGSRPWGRSESEGARNQLKEFLALFDHHNLVHGDLREPNILVCGGKVRVVDFDWAGTHESDVYPVAVNPGVKWAEGVQGAKTMLKEHDRFMVDRLLSGSDSHTLPARDAR
jgi:hypothetical protein